jgi:hypothetical protein
MASYLRLMLPFAAAVAVAGVLSMASPASAAEAAIGEGASAMAMSADVRQRTSQRIRLAALRDNRRDRYVRAIRSNLDCSGGWCGSQFVLMIGIAY